MAPKDPPRLAPPSQRPHITMHVPRLAPSQGRYPVHISGEQAGTDTNLTPLQFTLLSEKMVAGSYASHFIGTATSTLFWLEFLTYFSATY